MAVAVELKSVILLKCSRRVIFFRLYIIEYYQTNFFITTTCNVNGQGS